MQVWLNPCKPLIIDETIIIIEKKRICSLII